MKILILTHPLETNYGGILQNFALQQVLKDMRHDVLTIDCHHDKSLLYKFASWVLRIVRHYLLNNTHISVKYNINKSGKCKLEENPELKRFITDNIRLTKYISSYDKLEEVLDYNPECIIVGSDQVWQKQYFPYTFLNFAQHFHCLKISYAASGDLKWFSGFDNLEKCKNYISSFTALSVREDAMVEKCVDFLDVQPQRVLDPVFLVDKEIYLALIGSDVQKRTNTLATYILDENPSKTFFINQIAANKGLDIYKTYQTDRTKQIAPLEQWLSAIAYSDYVITDSFHGMVLSILFNKQFIVIGNKKRGLDRFSILGKLALKDRFVDEDDLSMDVVSNLSDIDYTAVNQRILEEKNISFDFLYKALGVK